MLVGSIRFSTDMADTHDSVDEMAYKDVVKALLAIGQLNKQDTEDLLWINSVRNKMIHSILKNPYDRPCNGFPKQEYDRVFQEAMQWIDKMLKKNEDFVG
jgi:hypothetical protein